MAKTLDTFNHYINGYFSDTDFIGASTSFSHMFGDTANSGSQTIVTDSPIVNDDIIRGNKGYSKMVLRGGSVDAIDIDSAVKEVRRHKYTAYGMSFPVLQDSFAISRAQIDERLAGMNPYYNTPVSGAREMALRQLAVDGKRDVIRRMLEAQNLLAKQSIYEGKQYSIFGTTNNDLKYDFDRNSDLFYTTTATWAGGSADPLADFDIIATRVHRIGKLRPDVALLDSSSFKKLIKDAAFKASGDTRRFNLIGIGASDMGNANPVSMMPADFSKLIDSGWNYMGWVYTPSGYKLNIFVGNDFVEEDNGDVTEVQTADKVIVMAYKGRKDRLYGPDDYLPITPTETRMYQEAFGVAPVLSSVDVVGNAGNLVVPAAYSVRLISADAKSVRMEVQCAPIFKTTQVDTIGVLTTTQA
jgi:hypothetical protein